MVVINQYDFQSVTDKCIKPEEQFMSEYVGESFKSENVRSLTKIMRINLYTRYKKSDLNKVKEEQQNT